MGYYINHNSKGEALPPNKVTGLLADGAAITDASFKENLICVANNGMFDAAAYIFSEREFEDFNYPSDGRPKTWLIHPKAKQLSGYEKQPT